MSALTDRIFSLKRRGHNNFEIANVVGLTPAQVVARLKNPSLPDPSSGVGLLPEAPGGGGGGGVVERVRVTDVTFTVPAGDTLALAPSLKIATIPLALPRFAMGLYGFAKLESVSDTAYDLTYNFLALAPEDEDVWLFGDYPPDSNPQPRPSWGFTTVNTIDPELSPDGGEWNVAAEGLGVAGNNEDRTQLVAEIVPDGSLPAEPPSAVDVHLIANFTDPDDVTYQYDFIEISLL